MKVYRVKRRPVLAGTCCVCGKADRSGGLLCPPCRIEAEFADEADTVHRSGLSEALVPILMAPWGA